MAMREVYVPVTEPPFYKAVPVEFEYNPGFAVSQKRKNIRAVHDGYSVKDPSARILEISSRSLQEEGVRASAFNLMKYVPELGKSIPVENVFQGGKVFTEGGPYTDLYLVSPSEAKNDARFRESGAIAFFYFNGRYFSTYPTTAFYDFIYINALLENGELSKKILRYDAFTDVEFNPQRSINCQAKSAAAFVALYRMGEIEKIKTFDTFMLLYGIQPGKALPEVKVKEKKKEEADPRLKEGAVITHRLWGDGIIIESGYTVTVLFEKVGKKRLSAEWLIKNCKI